MKRSETITKKDFVIKCELRGHSLGAKRIKCTM